MEAAFGGGVGEVEFGAFECAGVGLEEVDAADAGAAAGEGIAEESPASAEVGDEAVEGCGEVIGEEL